MIIWFNNIHLFAHSYVFKYFCRIQLLFKHIYLTYRGATTPDQSGLESNGNEKGLNLTQILIN